MQNVNFVVFGIITIAILSDNLHGTNINPFSCIFLQLSSSISSSVRGLLMTSKSQGLA